MQIISIFYYIFDLSPFCELSPYIHCYKKIMAMRRKRIGETNTEQKDRQNNYKAKANWVYSPVPVGCLQTNGKWS